MGGTLALSERRVNWFVGGDNNYNQTNAPTGTFNQVDVGQYHSCAVKTDGGIVCWGLNDKGQTTVPSGTFTQVSAGDNHTCGLKTADGTVVCWGDNSRGQTTLPTDLNAGVVVTPTPITYTQAQLDAAVNTAKQACVTNPTSCGISVSQNTDGSTQTGIDQCKANPTSCGISISSGYTEEQMSAAIIAGKQNCKISPASCGITVNQNTDGSTQAGIDQCKADPNCKGTTSSISGIHATYDAAKGELHVPFVDLITLGVVQTFDVYLMQRNGSFTFDLDFNRVVIVH